MAGWIDNVYGATGVLLGAAVGLLRTMHGNSQKRAEMVPADYVINSCLAATWDIATVKYAKPRLSVLERSSHRLRSLAPIGF